MMWLVLAGTLLSATWTQLRVHRAWSVGYMKQNETGMTAKPNETGMTAKQNETGMTAKQNETGMTAKQNETGMTASVLKQNPDT